MPRDCLHKILMLRNRWSYIVVFFKIILFLFTTLKVAFD